MQVLWAPWRGAYVSAPKSSSGCLFCGARDTEDQRAHLVLLQSPAVVMLNRYPYASTHLMVSPRRHTADLAGMPADEMHAVMSVLQRCVAVLGEVLRPDGMNVGLNLGTAAGAGITEHLHWHVVPRWTGDVNFMPLLADVRVMPEHLEATWAKLQPYFSPAVS